MFKLKVGSKLILEPPGDVQVMFGVGSPSAVHFRSTVSVSFTDWSGVMYVMFGESVKKE